MLICWGELHCGTVSIDGEKESENSSRSRFDGVPDVELRCGTASNDNEKEGEISSRSRFDGEYR